MTEIPKTTLTLHDLTLTQAIAGDGDPLLLLHGWGANIDLVWALAQPMTTKSYRVYALDMPGFGASPEPPHAWTVYDYAKLVIDYLDYHQLERVYLFGHSFGGRLGLILGADYHERIIKMALSDAAGVRPKTPLMTQLRLKSYKAVRDTLYTIGAKSLADNLRQRYNQRYGSTDFQQVSGVMRETFVNVVNEDLLPHAARVKVSTLLFWGDKDDDTPLWQGQLLEKTIPDAGLVVHEGAGHYAYLDYLADTTRVMDYFFKQD